MKSMSVHQLSTDAVRSLRLLGSVLLAVVALLSAAVADAGEGILIDGIHANDLSTVGLGPEVFEYHQTCGCRRSFEYLRAQGIRCDRATVGPLTSEQLAKYRLLFINLVSAERPPFLVSEIAAIRSFVEEGGSLLVVVDHSNCYYHTHRLKPLLAELDVESFYDSACEESTDLLGSGNGWIAITRFKTHPVTEGLQRLGMQTGGRVDPRFAVAWTSDRAWADAWSTEMFGHANGPGFYGNFSRDTGEASGPLGVVLAKTLGKGRIVLIADQNMIGESFLHYADNYRLWLNAVAWLLDDARLRDADAYQRWRTPRVVLYEPPDHPEFGRTEPDGAYLALVLLSRYWWTFAGDRWAEPCDLVVFAYDQCLLAEESVAAVVRHLKSGRNVLILNAEGQLLWEESSVVGQVLKALDLSPVKRQADGRLILDLPGCGSIHILGPDTVLDNGVLGPPTQAPDATQQEHDKRLLDAVREALKTS
jgi:hypothetical protein